MDLVRSIGKLFSRFSRRFCRSPDPAEQDEGWVGREGERLAAKFLKRNRFKVLYRNFRAPHGGEVDIVCRDKADGTLVFVEVKTRRSLAYGAPSESVTRAKQKLIIRGGLAWLKLLHDPPIHSRFDIVEVILTGDEVTYNLIRDAFSLPDSNIY